MVAGPLGRREGLGPANITPVCVVIIQYVDASFKCLYVAGPTTKLGFMANRHKIGDQIGPWTLRDYLGHGGNADVWEAQSGSTVVALKVLRKRRVDSEPYLRFRIESDLIQRYKPEGVVPIIDSFIPNSLKAGEYAWIAMPVAIPIRTALGPRPDFETVARAVKEVAQTLVSLGVITHRDIKPGNLYFLEGGFAISDFGLASFPGKEDLTGSEGELGPRNFLAPEMIARPAAASGHSADVYSLAKTLWALATGDPAPPPGQFRRDDLLLRLGTFVTHPRIYQVEELLEDATSTDPDRRPPMTEFKDRLGYFLDGVPSGPSDVRAAAAAVRGAVTSIEARIREGTDPANKLVLYELDAALQPVAEALVAAGLRKFKVLENEDVLYLPGRADSLRKDGIGQAWTGGRAIELTLKAFDNFPAFRMLSGIAIEVGRNENEAVLVAGHARNLGTAADQDQITVKTHEYWVGTRRVEMSKHPTIARALEELSFDLLENLRPALHDFAEDIEQWRFNAQTAREFGY